MSSSWEPVIGLEVHAQLRTEAKLFSAAPNSFGAAPNTQTTEIDLGMPGVLPVINRQAVELALRAALALGCKIQPLSTFARKHYFYPDLPKGYQISQYDEPYSSGGKVPISTNGELRSITLTRIHMEEDAGKLIHDDAITGGGASHVDLNRSGVPLIEIVSEPEIRSAQEAGAYLRSLRSILRYLEVSDADMEKGQFRCDANISVRRAGATELGTKVELKNMNSFKFVEHAIAYEIERQIEVLEEGGQLVQETRLWDEKAGETRPMRSKEHAHDYRYFPDPDLVPLRIEQEWVAAVRDQLPELPHEKRGRYEQELGLPALDAQVLVEDRDVAAFFEETVRLHPHPKTVSNWVMRSVLRVVSESGRELTDLPLTPQQLAALLELLEARKVTAASAREIFQEMAVSGGQPQEIMHSRGLEAVADSGELEGLVREVLEANLGQLEKYRAGEEKLFNFFVGQVMRRTQGKADPTLVRDLLTHLLNPK